MAKADFNPLRPRLAIRFFGEGYPFIQAARDPLKGPGDGAFKRSVGGQNFWRLFANQADRPARARLLLMTSTVSPDVEGATHEYFE
ncbi:hypothetical protein [Metapseudomonas sp. CR1201]|jgi:hypothetical protein